MVNHDQADALHHVRQFFRTQEAMAEALETTQATVSRWIKAGRIGVRFVLRAEELTGVSRHDLRPDIYPRETARDSRVGKRFAGVDRKVGQRASLQGSATA